MTLNILQ